MDIANFDALKAQGKILDLANVNQDEDYLLIGKYNNKYNTDSFKYTKYPVYAIKAKDLIAVATDGVTILGDGTPGSPLTTAAATAVQSVTGLDTDNTDPLNPVVNIAVDGITITGQGTPASPLVANFDPYLKTEINLSSAQILSLSTSPIQLLPDPGVGKYYDIDKMFFEFTFGTTPYVSQDLSIYNNGGPLWAFIYSQFVLLAGSENSYTVIERPRDYDSGNFVVTGYNQPLNKGYYLTTGSNPTGGDGTLRIIIYYKVRTFGI